VHNSRLDISAGGSIRGKARGVLGSSGGFMVFSLGNTVIVLSGGSCELIHWLHAWEAVNGHSIGVVERPCDGFGHCALHLVHCYAAREFSAEM